MTDPLFTFDEATHTYKVNGVVYPGVTEIIGEAGLYGNAARWFDDYSRDRGTAVHDAIRLYLKGTLDIDHFNLECEPIKGYLESYMRFEADTGFKPFQVEHAMYNHTYKVAGTADLIGPHQGDGSILDIKTSISIHPAEAIQLAGYELTWGERMKRYSLHLGADGKYRLMPWTDRRDRDIFLAAVAVYNWRKGNLR